MQLETIESMQSPPPNDYDSLIRRSSRPASHRMIEEAICHRSGGGEASEKVGEQRIPGSEEGLCFNYSLVFWLDQRAAGVFVPRRFSLQ